MEVVTFIDVLLGQADDIEQVLSYRLRVRRRPPRLAPVTAAHDMDRPDRHRVPVRSVIGMIGAIRMERVRNVESADFAMARNVAVEVSAAALTAERPVEPARAAAVGATVRHQVLPCVTDAKYSWGQHITDEALDRRDHADGDSDALVTDNRVLRMAAVALSVAVPGRVIFY